MQRKLKKLNAEIVAGNYQCKNDADKLLRGGDADEAGATEGFPFITLLLIVLGMVILFRFMWSESKLLLKKRKEFKAGFHTSDFIFYRLDHWFSKTKWAKPLLLLALTFFLILVGSLGLQIRWAIHPAFPPSPRACKGSNHLLLAFPWIQGRE